MTNIQIIHAEDIFLLSNLLSLLAIIGFVTANNILYSRFLLIFIFIIGMCIFFIFNAIFSGLLILMVYIGAIATLSLSIILMVDSYTHIEQKFDSEKLFYLITIIFTLLLVYYNLYENYNVSSSCPYISAERGVWMGIKRPTLYDIQQLIIDMILEFRPGDCDGTFSIFHSIWPEDLSSYRPSREIAEFIFDTILEFRPSGLYITLHPESESFFENMDPIFKRMFQDALEAFDSISPNSKMVVLDAIAENWDFLYPYILELIETLNGSFEDLSMDMQLWIIYEYYNMPIQGFCCPLEDEIKYPNLDEFLQVLEGIDPIWRNFFDLTYRFMYRNDKTAYRITMQTIKELSLNPDTRFSVNWLCNSVIGEPFQNLNDTWQFFFLQLIFELWFYEEELVFNEPRTLSKSDIFLSERWEEGLLKFVLYAYDDLDPVWRSFLTIVLEIIPRNEMDVLWDQVLLELLFDLDLYHPEKEKAESAIRLKDILISSERWEEGLLKLLLHKHKDFDPLWREFLTVVFEIIPREEIDAVWQEMVLDSLFDFEFYKKMTPEPAIVLENPIEPLDPDWYRYETPRSRYPLDSLIVNSESFSNWFVQTHPSFNQVYYSFERVTLDPSVEEYWDLLCSVVFGDVLSEEVNVIHRSIIPIDIERIGRIFYTYFFILFILCAFSSFVAIIGILIASEYRSVRTKDYTTVADRKQIIAEQISKSYTIEYTRPPGPLTRALCIIP